MDSKTSDPQLPYPGERIEHRTLGPGAVARLLDGCRKALVRFDRRPAAPSVKNEE